MSLKTASLQAAVLAVSLSFALSADISYNVNRTIGQGSITGTISTNGNFGILSVTDITGWNLLMTGAGGASLNITPGNTGVAIAGGALTADAHNLYFDFSGGSGLGDFLIQEAFDNGSPYYCDNNIQGGECFLGETVAPVFFSDITTQTVVYSDKQIIGSVAPAPEPGFYGILALGLAGVFIASRRRGKA